MPYTVHKVVLESVSDASGLAELIDDGGGRRPTASWR